MADLENRTYYELLGVEPSASIDEIKEAYREIARIYHPDSNFYTDIIDDTGPDGSDVFKAVTEAYQTLSNEEKRRAYDDSLPKYKTGWEDDSVADFHGYSAPQQEYSPPSGGATSSPDSHAGTADDDMPEEWFKEREYFAEHFEEILKPAPKVNLTGDLDLNAPGFAGMDSDRTVSSSGRFGSLDEESAAAYYSNSGLSHSRREVASLGHDPMSIIIYIGMPVMLIILIIELFLFF